MAVARRNPCGGDPLRIVRRKGCRAVSAVASLRQKGEDSRPSFAQGNRGNRLLDVLVTPSHALVFLTRSWLTWQVVSRLDCALSALKTAM